VDSAPSALPAARELCADASWQAIDFISDLHLCEALPRTFEAWAAHMRHTPAQAIFILGDLFEFWHGDDAGQQAFEGRCLQVLAEATQCKFIALMVGNRDFLLTPELLAQVGVHWLADPTLLRAWRQPVLLTHGDALCLDDVAYQQFRVWVRSEAVQREFLARPLAERVRVAAGFRHASETGRNRATSSALGSDVNALAAVDCLRAAGAVQMVHGHTHRPGTSSLAPGFERHVLSDWDVDAVPARAEVLRLRADGFARLPPATASERG
jgi:UDP-2,3-diacylglucosamine hydrolase